MNALPEAAHLAALASLPDVGPARLAALLARGTPAAVLADLAAGRLAADAALAEACRRRDPRALVEGWQRAAAALDVEALWRRHVHAGVHVLTPGAPGWPSCLDDDPDPPGVLFAAGALPIAAVEGPRVAIVGTRRCSRYGWDVAHRLGAELAAAGVVVVSGLARGIDAAAHRGALGAGPRSAPPIGVVATGLDVAYPRENAALWAEVAAAGALVGEAPLGTLPARWRFPARNRIIAALADVVVVVESAATGGALHTVDEALRRDRAVLAVPGPITSPASAGTNRLLRDVASPVVDVDDVLVAIGLTPGAGPSPAALRAARDDADDLAADPDPDAVAVLEAVGWTPATLDAVVARTGLPLGRAAATVARLQAAGAVVDAGGRLVRAERGVRITR